MATDSTAQKPPQLVGTLAGTSDSDFFDSNNNTTLKVGNDVTLTLGADALLIHGMRCLQFH